MLLLSVVTLCACGGGGEAFSAAPKIQVTVRQVAMADIPGLSRCLSTIDGALKKSAKQSDASLDCATGIYAGSTVDGRLCSLKVDGAKGSFNFEVDHEKVDIRWTTSAIAADGTPVHNLEDASTSTQPGIMLTKFTGSIQPITEALILRMSGGDPVLPKMIYQRFKGTSASSVQCNFGA
ncbi:hypothetical protein [Rhodoferax sp.]|uniref:hypothetical protein n=1 Tax=Rhodoferax sp. TaxID=50421 RepID=UPI002852750A|nr:hypothetical protein [Rhodoferax sp.]